LLDNYIDDSLGTKVEGHLNDLFEEDDKASVNERFEIHPGKYPLIELKSLVLSLDWEITDQVITDFLIHTDNLIEFYSNDKVILMFLRILRAIGKYIDANRSKSHPDSFKMLRSVFSTLDHVIQTKGISLPEKEKLLKTEVDQYKKLRQLIIDMKLSKLREKKQTSLISTDSKIMEGEKNDYLQLGSEHNGIIVPQHQLDELKKEIKQFLRSEFRILREELKQSLNLGDT
jgi:hypothetical protein